MESKTFGQSAVTDLKFNCQTQAHLFQRKSRDRDCAEVCLGLPSRAFFLMAVSFKAECDRALNERQHSSECRSLELSENVSELQHDQETRKLKS